MTQEELEWFEDNWNIGKTGRSATDHRRTWKLSKDIWDEPGEGGISNYYYDDINCWKSQRKTQYRIKKIHKDKVRKPHEKEHWRFKKNHHSIWYRQFLWKNALIIRRGFSTSNLTYG